MKTLQAIFKILTVLVTTLLIPVFFIILDLKQLHLQINLENFKAVFESQLIYPVSVFIFPFSGIIISSLIIKIRAQKTYIENIFSSVPDWYLILNDQLDIIKQNKNIHQFLPELADPAFLNIKELLKDLIGSEQFISEKTFKVGKLNIELLFTIKQYHINQSRLWIVSVKDVTQFNDYKNKLHAQKALLEHNEKLASLGEIASGIAHEINNPLSILQLNNELIRRTLNSHEQLDTIPKYLDRNTATIKRIANIINSLRKLSRDGDSVEAELTTLKNNIDDIQYLASGKLKNSSIEFEVIEKDLDINFFINKIHLCQVLINLINNAVDAVSDLEEKWIRVEAEDQSDYYFIRIVDSGKGIEQNVLNKLFQPLFTTKKIGKGTGIGLSLSKSLMQKYNVDLYYELYQGNTCFTLKIPKKLPAVA